MIDAFCLYDPSAVDDEKLDTVGAVTSRVIVVVAVAADTGPVLPAASDAPPEAKTGITVPPVVHVTVTVRELSESAPGSKVHVAVPLLEKSPATTPVTDSENVNVYAMLEAFVGDDAVDVKLDTVGAVTSVMLAPIDCAADVVLPRVAVYVKASSPEALVVGVYVKAPVADVIATVPFTLWLPTANVTSPLGS